MLKHHHPSNRSKKPTTASKPKKPPTTNTTTRHITTTSRNTSTTPGINLLHGGKKSKPQYKKFPTTLPTPHTTAQRFMETDPLRRNYASSDPIDATKYETEHVYKSARSANRDLAVLLGGYNSWFGQHLYTHLNKEGFVVIPVTHEKCHMLAEVQTLTYEQIADQGLPDVDFVINACTRNIYRKWNDGVKAAVEDAKLTSNEFFAKEIRKTTAKPYAYLNVSSALIYPPSHNTTYDESYDLPSRPLVEEINRPELQAQELSLPYFSRFYRDAESVARTFIPEIDFRTEEQIEEYRRLRAQILRGEQRLTIHGNQHHNITPEEYRQRSHRHNLLENRDVRNINLRLGHLVSKTMQEWKPFEHYFLSGLAAPLGDGQHVQPWIHVDDACQMAIWALTNHNISGPVNAVAPKQATHGELFDYVKSTNGFFSNPFCKNVSPQSAVDTVGELAATIYLDERKVTPRVAQENGFEWFYPSIYEAKENGRISGFEKIIYSVGGVDNLFRNSRRRPLDT